MKALVQIIQQRHTLKVLADPEAPFAGPDAAFDQELERMLEVASCAPYHYPCDVAHQVGDLDSPLPWRFHAMNAVACRRLLGKLRSLDMALGKVANMLAAADALVLATWLPDPDPKHSFELFAPTQRNMEHIAGAFAAVQNLLLLATEAGWNNYWSSGGVLRTAQVFDMLGIPTREMLLGAIFLFPSETHDAETKPGANRSKQGVPQCRMRWITVGHVAPSA